jgi:hypothetical protein
MEPGAGHASRTGVVVPPPVLRWGGLAALTGLLGEAADSCSARVSERSSGGATPVGRGTVGGVAAQVSGDKVRVLRSWRSASKGTAQRFRSRP